MDQLFAYECLVRELAQLLGEHPSLLATPHRLPSTPLAAALHQQREDDMVLGATAKQAAPPCGTENDKDAHTNESSSDKHKVANDANGRTSRFLNTKDSKEEASQKLAAALLSLDTLLGEAVLDKALAMSTRRGAVEDVVAQPSRRRVARVVGDSGAVYRVLPGFCACRHFADRASSALPLCKHMVAVDLARAQQLAEERVVSDQEWGAVALGEDKGGMWG